MTKQADVDPNLTIGQVAQAAGVNLQTVRYYQRRRLVPQPPKPASGYRRYGVDTIERIRFIKRVQGLGFRLDEIRELLALGGGRCDDVRRVAERQRALIATRITDLETMQQTLDALIDDCRQFHPPDRCPLIETLSRED
ncbi:MAG TPA: MerR family transcriptional regulator [Gammaproteobacteria bacterium]|nr:MerR family transcriptional regulator [Gammaproteobacteria bacterium]